MKTEIGQIAAALKGGNSKVRSVKRKEDGSAGFHRYLQAWILTGKDIVGNFLGVSVGTPLQRKLSKLAILLFCIAIVCAIIVEAANDFSSRKEVVIYGVATGLSMIPASLIVVLTITMAVGTKRMSKRNVIVRKLDSLEALGAVTNICSDKTGTLTQGRMVAKAAWIAGYGTFKVNNTGEPFNPTVGDIDFHRGLPIDESPVDKTHKPEELMSGSVANSSLPVKRLFNVCSLANVAHVNKNKEDQWIARGDPTEIALQVFASRYNWNRERLLDELKWQCLVEFPFDSSVKRMSVIYQKNQGEKAGERWLLTKGAIERVLPLCTHIQDSEGNSVPFPDDMNDKINRSVDLLASEGLRVLCLASAQWTREDVEEYGSLDRKDVEKDLCFRGIVGLYDPPRPESAASVAECGKAGINVHMLTGDHIGTARAIAKQIGIIPQNEASLPADVAKALAVTASEFDKLTDEAIDNLPTLPRVIARCTPHTKVRMIEALHRRKKFAAMTGDGVNDSPSLVRSDVGIAMVCSSFFFFGFTLVQWPILTAALLGSKRFGCCQRCF